MRWNDMRRSDNVEDRRGMSDGWGGAEAGRRRTAPDPGAERPHGHESARSPQRPGGDLAARRSTAGRSASRPRTIPRRTSSARCSGTSRTPGAELFEQGGGTYEAPRLVLFSGAVDSACGQASAAVGPFYCPPDRKVYLDLEFFRELSERFGAPGRLRARLRRRPRGRASRPEPPGDLGPGAAAALPHGPGRGERALRAARAPGGLLRRGVGLLRRAAQHPGAGGRRVGAGGGERPSATTACRSRRGATSCRSRSPTARPPSASGGSATGLESGDVRRCDTFAARP